MNIIKTISALISKLWRWIRETAWVQPLLIVGGIFAIIFSIPKFSTWFEAMGVSSSNSFYTQYRISLEGEGREDGDGKRILTEADKLTTAIDEMSFSYQNYSTYEDYRAALEKSGALAYGEKFYFVFYKTECNGCDEARNAFETLIEGWNTSFPIKDGRNFKMYAIQADQTSSNDETFEVDVDKKAINRYLTYFEAADLWASAAGRLEDAPYKKNAGLGDNNYTYVENTDLKNWPVPTLFLVDWSREAFEGGRPGISEVIFGVTGSDDFEKAQQLANMWNHFKMPTETTEDNTNPFRSSYRKA